MDEEYDVIVLGTGLTVSSQSGLLCACTGTKKQTKKKQGGMRELPCGYYGQRVDAGPLSSVYSWLEVKGFLHPSEPAKK